MFGLFGDSLAGWLAGRLAGLLAGWLAGLLADEVDIHKKKFKLFFQHREKDSQGIFFWVPGSGEAPSTEKFPGIFSVEGG